MPKYKPGDILINKSSYRQFKVINVHTYNIGPCTYIIENENGRLYYLPQQHIETNYKLSIIEMRKQKLNKFTNETRQIHEYNIRTYIR